jgi:alanine racemase
VYTSQQIAKISNGNLSGSENISVKHLLTDSRSINFFSECAFFALASGRNNGHKYILDLYEKGVRCFIVSEKVESNFKDCAFITVKNVLKALQELARYHRSQFHIPVIAVTGSNGKTIVKEWLYQLLKNKYTICRSPKSYNSQIGVPISVWNLNSNHNLGIFEAGISLPNEMNTLQEIIKPTLGVFTGLGAAHQEGFKTPEEKLLEKFKLFEHCSSLVIQGLERKQIPAHLSVHELTLISEHEDADIVIEKTVSSTAGSDIILKYKNKNYSIHIPFTDQASIINATTCFGVLVGMRLDPSDFINGFKELQSVALRLEIKTGINNSVLINDFYNSDKDSFIIALNHLHQQSHSNKKIVILSDIEQSGKINAILYKELADLIAQYKIDIVIGVGRQISEYRNFFKTGSFFFNSTNDFISEVNSLHQLFYNSTILLKGARSFGFEKISQVLQQKSHDTVLEINLNNLVENINYYKGLLSPNTKIMCMVKAMGYGSGSVEIAKTLQHLGAGYLAVAYADEGVDLRHANINLPIMVMSPEQDSFEDIINHQLEPEIYSLKILNDFCNALDKIGFSEPYPVHIKIDTGMHRLGFDASTGSSKEIDTLIEQLLKKPQVLVKSVFSHLVGADDPEMDNFTKEQISIFKNCFEKLEDKLGYKFLRHICNSGGTSRFKEAHFDMVRLGIGMYGIGINKEEQKKLKNVGSLKTRISQIKHLHSGQTVGYNRNGKIEKETSIATIPIGYADGFRRELGNGKLGVYINGKFCKTVGNVCMDMCMVDVTNVNCREGDEVVVFENFEQIQNMANAENTIPYELLTSLSARIKRVYVQE